MQPPWAPAVQTSPRTPRPPPSRALHPQVAKFCGEQADAAGAAPAADADDRRTLWAVLQVLAAHQGRASTAPYPLLPPASGSAGSGKAADPAAQPEAQLAAALMEGVAPAAADAQLLLPAVPAAPGAVAEVQRLLLAGQRADALR